MRQLFAEDVAAEQAPLKTLANFPAIEPRTESLTVTNEFVAASEPANTQWPTGSPADTARPDSGSKIRRRRRFRLLNAAVVLLAAASAFFLFQKDPGRSMLERAEACMKSGDYAKAAEVYEQFLERYPAHIESIAAPYTRALQELPETRAERAKSILQQQALTENAQAWFLLGFVCNRLKDTAGAAAAYEAAIQFNPNFTESYFNLGHLYAQEKKYPQSEAMFRKVVELAPSYLDEALYNLAVVLDLQGKKEESSQCLQRALSANPHNEKARAYLVKQSKPRL
jgi:tetratricopeptide (TPR) repeat protein